LKLLRYNLDSDVKVGVLVDDQIIDLSGLGITRMMDIIAGGDGVLSKIESFVAEADSRIDLDSVTLLPPIERPSKYLAIGLNYALHVDEAEKAGVARNPHQTWFNKQTSCLSGPFDTIDPGVTEKLDYEVELGAVIGVAAKGVSPKDALGHVFGYVVANDVSARDWQFHSQTFTVGKSFDTHGPIGPWIVTANEIPDPQDLNLRCLVNGEVRQESSTRLMIHSIADQISYLSTAFTLEPGDLIATGTPDGVGMAMDPPIYLQDGDIVRCEIDGIGAIENRVRAARGAVQQ